MNLCGRVFDLVSLILEVDRDAAFQSGKLEGLNPDRVVNRVVTPICV